MRAYVSIGADVIELRGPLAMTLAVVAAHLPVPARATLERIARLDRERTPGEHELDRAELLELIAAAHALLADPPASVRKQRRLATGSLPGTDAIHALAGWLATCGSTVVIYDLWRSAAAPAGD